MTMTACAWCGDTHRSDQLCQRAERGMTRRSFCFLFGAGIAGAMLPATEPVISFDGVPMTKALKILSDRLAGTWHYKLEFVTVDGQVIPFDDQLAAKIGSDRGFR